MRIVILSPSDQSFIKFFLPNYNLDDLPVGYIGAPFIGAIIQELLNKKHEVIAITTDSDLNIETKEFGYKNFRWVVVPQRKRSFRSNDGKRGFMLDFFSKEIKGLTQVVNNYSPDIIHAHWSYEFAAVSNMIDIPALVTIHDNPYIVLKYFKNAYRFGRLLMSEQVLRKVKYASTVSPYMLKYVKKKCAHVRVIPNPIDIKFDLVQIEIFVQRRISTMGSPKILMVNSGWDSRKNGKTALIAFQQFLQSYPNAKLHLIGGGCELNGLANIQANSLGINNIEYHGIITNDDIFRELENTHLFIHPALEESFGVVLIEAMSMGVPVIGGQASGAVPWVINDPRLLVDVKNSLDIKNKMIEILGDKEEYIKTSLSCYHRVKDRFSAPNITEEYLVYYNEIIEGYK